MAGYLWKLKMMELQLSENLNEIVTFFERFQPIKTGEFEYDSDFWLSFTLSIRPVGLSTICFYLHTL